MKKLLMLAALITTTSYAAVYMQEGANGTITYSDTPSTNAKKIEIPVTNTISTKHENTKSIEQPVAAAIPEGASATEEVAISGTYNTFEIVSPKNEETITNQPSIPVQMNIQPSLQPTDKIQLMLDDSPVGTPVSSTYQELGLVERGTHTLYAIIMGPENNIIKKSETITIFVHRNTAILSPTGN